jgi:hypothetical protein
MKVALLAGAACLLLLAGLTLASCGGSTNQQKAAAFVGKYGTEATRVQTDVAEITAGIAILSKGGSQADVNTLAQMAQESHDDLNTLRDDFALAVTTQSGSLQDAQYNAMNGVNDLKKSIGALVTYLGAPNAATLASFTTQYQKAKGEWNSGVTTIWQLAGKSKPPAV